MSFNPSQEIGLNKHLKEFAGDADTEDAQLASNCVFLRRRSYPDKHVGSRPSTHSHYVGSSNSRRH